MCWSLIFKILIFNHRIHGTVERNLLQWTRDSLILPTIVKIYQIVSFILFTLQVFLIAPFSNTNWYYFIAGLGTVGTVLLFVLLDYGYRRYQHRQDANSLPPYSVKGGPSIDAKKLVFICMAVILFGEFLFVPSFPTILYALRTIMLVAVLALVWWINAPRIYHSKQQVLWSRFLEIWPFHYQSDHILGDGHDQYWCHFDWLLWLSFDIWAGKCFFKSCQSFSLLFIFFIWTASFNLHYNPPYMDIGFSWLEEIWHLGCSLGVNEHQEPEEEFVLSVILLTTPKHQDLLEFQMCTEISTHRCSYCRYQRTTREIGLSLKEPAIQNKSKIIQTVEIYLHGATRCAPPDGCPCRYVSGFFAAPHFFLSCRHFLTCTTTSLRRHISASFFNSDKNSWMTSTTIPMPCNIYTARLLIPHIIYNITSKVFMTNGHRLKFPIPVPQFLFFPVSDY